MSDSTEEHPPQDVPDDLIDQIDSLDDSGLEAVQSYVEQRIDSRRSPLEEEIEANPVGDVIEIEEHGASALVRTHPPDPDGPGVRTDVVSLYRVRRNPEPGGEESLHWTYLGDIGDPSQTRCESCGRLLETDVAVCPHCGSNDVEHTEGS